MCQHNQCTTVTIKIIINVTCFQVGKLQWSFNNLRLASFQKGALIFRNSDAGETGSCFVIWLYVTASYVKGIYCVTDILHKWPNIHLSCLYGMSWRHIRSMSKGNSLHSSRLQFFYLSTFNKQYRASVAGVYVKQTFFVKLGSRLPRYASAFQLRSLIASGSSSVQVLVNE